MNNLWNLKLTFWISKVNLYEWSLKVKNDVWNSKNTPWFFEHFSLNVKFYDNSLKFKSVKLKKTSFEV